MFSSSLTSCILMGLLIVACQADSRNSFDNFVMSYGDFERCSFGLCRHGENIVANKKQPLAVSAIKKATGGGQRKRKSPKHYAQMNQERSRCETSLFLQCGSRDHAYGWGMF